MGMNDEVPKLRLVPVESADEIARRLNLETKTENVQREMDLEQSLAPFRVGSVSYLNAAPLTRGIEDQIVLTTPAKLAQLLQKDELDAGLVSVVEVLMHDRYDILDGIAIASLGEVKSVFLAHRVPIETLSVVYCDPASLTSVRLLQVILGQRGLKPEFKPLPEELPAGGVDGVLLIGNRAIDFLRAPHQHELLDLGAAWLEMTGLPFVYAVWALRRGIENSHLRRQLRAARDFGMDTLDSIIRTRTEYDFDFRKDYLGWHIHYHLGSDEKRGLARFVELLRAQGLGPVYEPRYVS